ncbi:MAG: glycoside hydrolase family 16 protein [Armatimonas sp.]
MRTRLTAAALTLAATAHAQRPAQGPMSTTPFVPEKAGYKMVWEDEFEGTQLDPKKWEVRGIGPRGPAFVSADAVKVKNGHLELWAMQQGDKMLSSAVGTQGLFMPRYGYFECRARLQKCAGVWGAFWIQSTEISKGEDPAIYGAEIDIMECFRKLGTDIVSHNVHWAYGPNQKSTRGMQSYLKGVGMGFHTFGLEWTPDKYIFYVDRMPFYEVTQGISHIPEYLILSMEYPNNPADLAPTVFPDVFTVDYVRVWQKPEQRQKAP